jgi:hypothetical protein
VGAARARELENRSRELERAGFDRLRRCLELHQQGGDVDASVRRAIRRQPAARLLELALAADPLAAAGLVPGDRDVDETLKEVALGRLGGAPRVLQFLVGGEELAGPDQLEAALERTRSRP